MVTEEELRRKVLEWVVEQGTGKSTMPIDETVDLIGSGALDSMGYIELLTYIETLIDRKIDVQELDASAFTSIQTLVSKVLAMRVHA